MKRQISVQEATNPVNGRMGFADRSGISLYTHSSNEVYGKLITDLVSENEHLEGAPRIVTFYAGARYDQDLPGTSSREAQDVVKSHP